MKWEGKQYFRIVYITPMVKETLELYKYIGGVHNVIKEEDYKNLYF